MLKLLFQILFVVLLARMARGLFRGIARSVSGKDAPEGRVGSTADGNRPTKKDNLEELSPYDIEDADYEEIKSD